jgi:acyl-CoA synthetase (AMP-forming)/AMP-acid ligase II
MPESLLLRLKAAFPQVRFIQTFGTSETGITHTVSPEPGSTFLRFEDPHLEWKVVDDELWLRSRTQVAGYLNASNERFTADGWFRTGDKVEQGPNGSLRILGRMGETINVGGEKLMPSEVESVVLTVPGVADCRVRGEAHPLTGQTVAVDVVSFTSDQEALRSAIRIACRERLARLRILRSEARRPVCVLLRDDSNLVRRLVPRRAELYLGDNRFIFHVLSPSLPRRRESPDRTPHTSTR